MDAEQINKLKDLYPTAELHLLTSKSAELVVKVSKSEVDLFRELISQPATKARAMERFVRSCIVHPSGEEVAQLFMRKPGIVEKLGDELMTIAGTDEEIETKKL